MASKNNYPAKPTIITILIAAFSLTLTAAVNPLSTDPAALFHDVLKSNGLPIGLFPKGISDFSHDAASGHFELRLLYPSPCDTKFETHVRYQCNITGSLGYGRIANLSGVAAQELFLWLPVKGVHVDVPSSGLIYFDVGVVFKQFSLSFFEAPKDCDAMEGDDGEDDVVVSFDDREREQIIENHPEEFVRKSFTDEEQRAVS
ncbi:hypothetical protein CASFOL_003628 [Castilleja foliolosa]|uniref:Uncharacterized protein n=1 Tax=Castilleja foliolosa TaxID=1961234 RepID=A0ABD3EJK2_9LAMI